MRFEWDEVKDQANFKKHGVSFALAKFAFSDPERLEAKDLGEYDEDRWVTTALVQGVELVVTYTMRGDRVRLISARRAERYEREDYWQHRA